MNIQNITYSNLEYINKWYEKRELTTPSNIIRSNTGYMVVNNDGKAICAMWIYYTNSNIAIFEELISDPESSRKERSEGIDMLLEFACDLIKLKGFKVVMAFSENTALMSRLKRHKFDLVSDKILQYVKIVDGGSN
mgnify:CR=1 FL=1